MTKKTELDIKIKEYQNKTRKGKYIVIRTPGTKDRSMFKWEHGYWIDDYVDLFEKSRERRGKYGKGKRIGAKAYKKMLTQIRDESIDKNTKKFMKKYGFYQKQYGGLKKAVPKGQNKIRTTLSKMTKDPETEYRRLLAPMVRNKKLLKLIVNNIDKVKSSLFYELTVMGHPIIDEKKQGTNVVIGRTRDQNRTIQEYTAKNNPIFKPGIRISAKGGKYWGAEDYFAENQTRGGYKWYKVEIETDALTSNTIVDITFTK